MIEAGLEGLGAGSEIEVSFSDSQRPVDDALQVRYQLA